MLTRFASPRLVIRLARTSEAARHYVLRLHQLLAPPPAVITEMIVSGWTAQAITAAADLKVADAMAAGPLSVEALARDVGADPDALDRLMRALVSRVVFAQRRDGRYRLNALAETLRSDTPVSLAGAARFYGSRLHREDLSMLTASVQTGESGFEKLRGMDFWEFLATTPELAELFNQAMTSLSKMSAPVIAAAYDFTPFRTVVDVGGGQGRLLAAILDVAPGARGVLFDLPDVVAEAPALLRQLGVGGRVDIVGGSFFDSAPEGDVYVLKHVIHDWGDDDAVSILRNIRSAAPGDALILLAEIVIPQHHRENLGKLLDLEMLIGGEARERTAEQYRRLLDRAGLRMTRILPTAGPHSLIEARSA